jgi:hypothetical protein
VVGAILTLARLTVNPQSGAPDGRGPGGIGAGSPLPGGVDGCRRSPSFVASLALAGQPALATSLTNVKGLAILYGSPDHQQVYQHETWDDAGFLGPFITDRNGNIYTAPVPLVSLQDNPPELQNRVYRVDSDTQAMSLLVELPPAPVASGGNPFGAVGLAYDCDTESLYVTSVAGSTAKAEVGRIFQVDLRTATVAAQVDGVDAIGVGVFNGTSGKRLYYGSARRAEVDSVALDDSGAFAGEARREVALGAVVRGGRDTVRRIRFGTTDMTFQLMDFSYSLQVAGERQEDEVTLTYDVATDAWSAPGASAPVGR